jgi:CheY-like chemotaxis protein
VLLAVSDSGHGMDEATKARMFEPFFTTKGVGQGTGLGLAVVDGVVRQSGGLIEVDSQVGQGTTFNIYLPRVEEAVAPLKASSSRLQLPKGTETVLLVDDDDGVRSLVSTVLRSNGYTVLEARDGEEALRVGRGHAGPIHLLLTDVVMPRMSGRLLADLLAPQRPEMKVLFASGYTGEVVGQHGVREGSEDHLPKPFVPSTLAWKVRGVLDAAKRTPNRSA